MQLLWIDDALHPHSLLQELFKSCFLVVSPVHNTVCTLGGFCREGLIGSNLERRKQSSDRAIHS